MNKLLTSKGANIFVVLGQKPNNTCFNTRLNFDVDKALYIYRKKNHENNCSNSLFLRHTKDICNSIAIDFNFCY